MAPTELKKLIGKNVLIKHKKVVLTGQLLELDPRWDFRDVVVKLLNNSEPQRFWARRVIKAAD